MDLIKLRNLHMKSQKEYKKQIKIHKKLQIIKILVFKMKLMLHIMLDYLVVVVN